MERCNGSTARTNAVHLRLAPFAMPADNPNECCGFEAPSSIQGAIGQWVIAHLALDATVVSSMAFWLDALFKYFLNDCLVNLRPTPPGGKFRVLVSFFG
jgi:hypothetical protein